MDVRSKVGPVLFIFIATLVASCWVGYLSASVQIKEPSSGCHSHSQSQSQNPSRGSTNPQPAPIHDCCLTGHDAAIPQFSSAQRPRAECHQRICAASDALPTVVMLGVMKISRLPPQNLPAQSPCAFSPFSPVPLRHRQTYFIAYA